jgi:hypothetical protein
VHEVIIQEGVYTFESVDGAVAEPVVYMMDQFVVGGFYRVHTERGVDENLNSPGAKFAPLAFETNCHTPDCLGKPGDPPNRFYTYGVVARLANLAAAIEVRSSSSATARWRSGRRTHEARVRRRSAAELKAYKDLEHRDDARGRAPRPRGARAGGARHVRARRLVMARRAASSSGRQPTGTGPGAAQAALAAFDCVLMRKDPPFDQEYYYATLLLDGVKRAGRLGGERPARLARLEREARDPRLPAAHAAHAGGERHGAVHDFIDAHGDVVVKKLDGMGGTMIFRVKRDDVNRNVIVESDHRLGRRTIMAQRFIPRSPRATSACW